MSVNTSQQMSAPREKFLLVPFRKFLLTTWKDGPGNHGTDTEGTGPAGSTQASPTQADHAEKSRRTDAGERTLGAPVIEAHEDRERPWVVPSCGAGPPTDGGAPKSAIGL